MFDVMAELSESTSGQIADAAKLNERYVREWLSTVWSEENALEILKGAGFENVNVNRLDHDFMNTYYVATK